MLTREGRYTDASLALAASKANLEDFTQFVEQYLQRVTSGHSFGNYDEADVRRIRSAGRLCHSEPLQATHVPASTTPSPVQH